MKFTLQQPPTHLPISEMDPVLFLAGSSSQRPADWHTEAFTVFEDLPNSDQHYHIAAQQSLSARGSISKQAREDWQEVYIDRAESRGGFLFWFSSAVKVDTEHTALTAVLAGDILSGARAHDYTVPVVLGIASSVKRADIRRLEQMAERLDVPVVNKLSIACKTLVEQVEDVWG